MKALIKETMLLVAFLTLCQALDLINVNNCFAQKVYFVGQEIKSKKTYQLDSVKIRNLSQIKDTIIKTDSFDFKNYTNVEIPNCKEKPIINSETQFINVSNIFDETIELFINSEAVKSINIGIFDLMGKFVYFEKRELNLGNNYIIIDSRVFSSGFYFLNLRFDNSATFFKLFKTRNADVSVKLNIQTNYSNDLKILKYGKSILNTTDKYDLIGFKSGFENDTIKNFIPDSNTTVTFNLQFTPPWGDYIGIFELKNLKVILFVHEVTHQYPNSNDTTDTYDTTTISISGIIKNYISSPPDPNSGIIPLCNQYCSFDKRFIAYINQAAFNNELYIAQYNTENAISSCHSTRVLFTFDTLTNFISKLKIDSLDNEAAVYGFSYRNKICTGKSFHLEFKDLQYMRNSYGTLKINLNPNEISDKLLNFNYEGTYYSQGFTYGSWETMETTLYKILGVDSTSKFTLSISH